MGNLMKESPVRAYLSSKARAILIIPMNKVYFSILWQDSLRAFEGVPSIDQCRTRQLQHPRTLIPSLRWVQNDGVGGRCAVQREAHSLQGLQDHQSYANDLHTSRTYLYEIVKIGRSWCRSIPAENTLYGLLAAEQVLYASS